MADIHQSAQDKMVADALRGSWVHRFLPQFLWPYAQLARWERPIGWWLLMWPCWWSSMLAAGLPGNGINLWHLALFLMGAVLMRGAGCTYNDLVDQDIDDKVARTRSRPLPSGRVSRRHAAMFLVAQSLLGLVVLLQFNWNTILLGILSLATIAIYPFMKRITFWPQLFLGLSFSWGALVGWSALEGGLSAAPLVLYAGCIAWVIGYDTIYALQDVEDDALVGVKSTARLFGDRARPAITLLYGLAVIAFAAAFVMAGTGWPAWVGLGAGVAHMAWQVRSLNIDDPQKCLMLFKSNGIFGWILFAGLAVAAVLPAQ